MAHCSRSRSKVRFKSSKSELDLAKSAVDMAGSAAVLTPPEFGSQPPKSPSPAFGQGIV